MPGVKLRIILIWFVLLSVFLTGCNPKDEDNPNPPSIHILVPAQGDSFLITDTIFVSIRISHNKPITQASVTLIDNINNPVTNTVTANPNVNDYLLEGYLVFNNQKLASGIYELMVRASDGSDASSDYIDVYVEGIPLRLRQLWAITRQNDLKTYITRYDSLFFENGTVTINMGYGNSIINAFNGHFYFAGLPPSGLYAYDLDSLDVQWDYQPPSPYTEIYGLSAYGQLVYTGTGNGSIIGLNANGLTKVNTPLNTDRIPWLVYRGSKYIVSYQTSRSGPEKYVALNYGTTGAGAGSIRTQLDVKGFGEKNTDKIYVFGNVGDTAYVMVLDAYSGQIYEEANLKKHTFQSMVGAGPNKYVLATENALYEYNALSQHLYQAIPAPGIGILAYDEVSGFLFAAGLYNIRIYDYETGGLVTTLQTPFPIVNLHIRYNR